MKSRKTTTFLIPLRGLCLDDSKPQQADGTMEKLHQLTLNFPDGERWDNYDIAGGCGCSCDTDNDGRPANGCSIDGTGGKAVAGSGLTGVALMPKRQIAVPAGSRLVGEHRTAAYHHLITECLSGGSYHYGWTDGTTAPHPIILPDGSKQVNSMAAVGDILCLVCDDCTYYALWQPAEEDYAVISVSQLGYDLLISQDQQQRVYASQPIDNKLRSYLAAPEAPLRSKPTVAAHLFGESYTESESFATNATLIRAAAESAIDQAIASRGGTLFKHIVFGVAVLRLFDGSALHYSPIFALIPAEVSDTVESDGTDIGLWTWLHRHTLRVTLHHSAQPAATLVQGLDVYLSEPVTFTALHTASAVTRDGEGNVTSITYPFLDLAHTEALYRRLTFRHALRVGTADFGSEVLLHPASPQAPALDMSDMGHLRYGARHTFAYARRLHLADVTPVLSNPFAVSVRYRYATLTAAERQDATLRATEWLAGERPDISDQPLGGTAELVLVGITDSVRQERVVFRGQVAYPLPGALQMGSRHLTWLEAHLRVETDSGVHYYVRRSSLLSTPRRDLSDAAYTTTGGIHRISRPAYHSLLLQEVRALAYDSTTGTYGWSYDLWSVESAAAYEQAAAEARWEWPLERRPSTLLWSAEGNPLILGETSSAQIGSGILRSITPCTRRTANNLIGEYPLYAFTDEGVWALRLDSGFHWHARQPVSPAVILPMSEAVATDDSVVFLGQRGVMELKGNRLVCLSEPLGQRPAAYWDGMRLLYDVVRHFLLVVPRDGEPQWAWLYHADKDCWSTVAAPYQELRQVGDTWWGVGEGSERMATLTEVSVEAAAVDYCFVTRPFTLDQQRHLYTLRGVCLTGSPEAVGSAHLVVEGSHDGACWHPICQSCQGAVSGISGSGYRWFRLCAEGHMEKGSLFRRVLLGGKGF